MEWTLARAEALMLSSVDTAPIAAAIIGAEDAADGGSDAVPVPRVVADRNVLPFVPLRTLRVTATLIDSSAGGGNVFAAPADVFIPAFRRCAGLPPLASSVASKPGATPPAKSPGLRLSPTAKKVPAAKAPAAKAPAKNAPVKKAPVSTEANDNRSCEETAALPSPTTPASIELRFVNSTWPNVPLEHDWTAGITSLSLRSTGGTLSTAMQGFSLLSRAQDAKGLHNVVQLSLEGADIDPAAAAAFRCYLAPRLRRLTVRASPEFLAALLLPSPAVYGGRTAQHDPTLLADGVRPTAAGLLAAIRATFKGHVVATYEEAHPGLQSEQAAVLQAVDNGPGARPKPSVPPQAKAGLGARLTSLVTRARNPPSVPVQTSPPSSNVHHGPTDSDTTVSALRGLLPNFSRLEELDVAVTRPMLILERFAGDPQGPLESFVRVLFAAVLHGTSLGLALTSLSLGFVPTAKVDVPPIALSAASLYGFLQRCPSLESLKLHNATVTDSVPFGSAAKEESKWQLFKAAHCVTRDGDGEVDEGHCGAFLKAAALMLPALTTLHFVGPGAQWPTPADLTSDDVRALLTAPSALPAPDAGGTPPPGSHGRVPLPRLTDLDLSGAHRYDASVVAAVAARCSASSVPDYALTSARPDDVPSGADASDGPVPLRRVCLSKQAVRPAQLGGVVWGCCLVRLS